MSKQKLDDLVISKKYGGSEMIQSSRKIANTYRGLGVSAEDLAREYAFVNWMANKLEGDDGLQGFLEVALDITLPLGTAQDVVNESENQLRNEILKTYNAFFGGRLDDGTIVQGAYWKFVAAANNGESLDTLKNHREDAYKAFKEFKELFDGLADLVKETESAPAHISSSKFQQAKKVAEAWTTRMDAFASILDPTQVQFR